MKEAFLFVPYDIALALKELNFNVSCFGYYLGDGNNHSNTVTRAPKFLENWNIYSTRVSAPIYQQVFDWFKAEHGIQVFFDYTFYNGFYYGYKWCTSHGNYGSDWKEGDGEYPDGWDTIEEARLAAINALIKMI